MTYINYPIITSLELFKSTQYIENNVNKFKLPIWIGHGDDDNAPPYKQLKKFCENCGVDKKDLVFKIYKNKGHLLYDEEPEIIRDIALWIIQRIDNNTANIDCNEREESTDLDVDETDAFLMNN